jgi:hypothetical protein
VDLETLEKELKARAPHAILVRWEPGVDLKMVSKCRGNHAKRVMVAHLAGGPIGPRLYIILFGSGLAGLGIHIS